MHHYLVLPANANHVHQLRGKDDRSNTRNYISYHLSLTHTHTLYLSLTLSHYLFLTLSGEQLRDQVEERLKFYDTGDAPRKNVDVMSAVAESLRKIATKTEKVSKKSKKSIGGDEEAGDEEKKEKKDKKDKKRSKEVADAADEVVEEDEGKKKKKKKVRLTFNIT